jgi:hypothetical protein
LGSSEEICEKNMARPGFIRTQSVLQDNIPRSGTIVYEGTILSINNVETATIIGGTVLKSNKLSQLDAVGIIGVSEDTGSITGARVVSFGKSLGTLTGTGVGTQLADSNTILVQLFAGTVGGVSQPVAGSTIRGTVLAQLQGV